MPLKWQAGGDLDEQQDSDVTAEMLDWGQVEICTWFFLLPEEQCNANSCIPAWCCEPPRQSSTVLNWAVQDQPSDCWASVRRENSKRDSLVVEWCSSVHIWVGTFGTFDLSLLEDAERMRASVGAAGASTDLDWKVLRAYTCIIPTNVPVLLLVLFFIVG